MKSAQVTFRTDGGTKNLAASRAQNEGVSLTTVLDAFLSAYAAGKIHLNIGLRSESERVVVSDDEMGDGLGPFGSRERYEKANADYLAGVNVVNYSEVRRRIREETASVA